MMIVMPLLVFLFDGSQIHKRFNMSDATAKFKFWEFETPPFVIPITSPLRFTIAPPLEPVDAGAVNMYPCMRKISS